MSKKPFVILFAVLFLAAAGYVCVAYYSQVFAKTVQGRILKVERITQPGAVIANGEIPNRALFSFAVSVQDQADHLIYTAATEDTRWATVAPSRCAIARFFPYPPWHLEKRGTYFGAQLVEELECPAAP